MYADPPNQVTYAGGHLGNMMLQGSFELHGGMGVLKVWATGVLRATRHWGFSKLRGSSDLCDAMGVLWTK